MSVRWERLAGDTAVFATRFTFMDDPDGGLGADPDEAASWGAFSIWAGGANLTAFADSGNIFESVNWYLLPLLEWLVANWDVCLHEEKLPCRVSSDDAASSLAATAFPPASAGDAWEAEWHAWWCRHSIQAARHGGPFPDIVLRRWRDEVEISWRNRSPMGIPTTLEFLAASGAARFEPASVAQPLFEVMRGAAQYLLQRRPESVRIKTLVNRLKELSGVDRRTVRLAWLAGLGRTPEDAISRWTAALHSISDKAEAASQFFEQPVNDPLVVTGSCHGTLLFGSAAPTINIDDVLQIANAMAKSLVSTAEAKRVELLARPTPVRLGSAAWEQGYELAEWLRDELGLDADEIPDIEKTLQDLGVKVVELGLSDPSIRAVSFSGAGLEPGLLVNASKWLKPQRRRFTLAHELCHLLVDRDKGKKLAIVSGPWAPLDVERRANAFAAAFLMPEQAVAAAVGRSVEPIDTLEGIGHVAEKLNASLTATIERLHDLGHLDDVRQEYLKDVLKA
jgi:Zn-dependent peptidase ImmA (M78 family)